MEGDTPAHRQSVEELREDQIEQHLVGVRTRRLQAARIYEENQLASKQVNDVRLAAKYKQQLTILERELASLDKLMDKIDKRCLNVRGIRMEIES